jgi:hypothetical protein
MRPKGNWGLPQVARIQIASMKTLELFDPRYTKTFWDMRSLGVLTPEQLDLLLGLKEEFQINSIWPEWETHPDWDYTINKYNFRDQFPLGRKKNIAVFGCSATMGVGVENSYSQILQNRLGDDWGVFNLGTPSNHIIHMYKKFIATLHVTNLDTVIFTFPHLQLLCFRDNMFRSLSALSGIKPNSIEWITLLENLATDDYKELREDVRQGKEPINLKQALMFYIDAIVKICNERNINLIMGGWDSDVYFHVSQAYPEFTLKRWEWSDYAYDDGNTGHHPGVNTHLEWAEECLKRINPTL